LQNYELPVYKGIDYIQEVRNSASPFNFFSAPVDGTTPFSFGQDAVIKVNLAWMNTSGSLFHAKFPSDQ